MAPDASPSLSLSPSPSPSPSPSKDSSCSPVQAEVVRVANATTTATIAAPGSAPPADIGPDDDDESDESESDREARLLAFRDRRSDLRFGASRVAAMSGFNPHADLPRLFLDLVYQGRTGSDLLRRDASTLGLEFKTDDEILSDLAERGGATEALRHAFDVRDGRRAAPTDVESASSIKERVTDAAKRSGRLTESELDALREGVRGVVDAGYGSRHEEEALDWYEKLCGWEVRERNDRLMRWPFERADTDGGGATAVPMGSAETVARRGEENRSDERDGARRHRRPKSGAGRKRRRPLDRTTDEAEGGYACGGTGGEPRERSPPEETAPSYEKVPNGEMEVRSAESAKTGASGDGGVEDGPRSGANETGGRRDAAPNSAEVPIAPSAGVEEGNRPEGSIRGSDDASPMPAPYFSILGSIDGVRDELHRREPPRLNECNDDGRDGIDDDDDGWALRRVLVECKHRMRRAVDPPPLYDQIQTVVYCLMLGVDEGEIVQVVRSRRGEEKGEEAIANDGRRNDDDASEPTTERRCESGTATTAKEGAAATNATGEKDPGGDAEPPPSRSEHGSPRRRSNSDGAATSGGREPSSGGVNGGDAATRVPCTPEEAPGEPPSKDAPSAPRPPPRTDDEGRDGREGDASSDGANETSAAPSAKSRTADDADDGGQTRASVESAPRPRPTMPDERGDRTTSERPSVDITVSRISLDDPTMSHRSNFRDVVLPRLRSFVDAVYATRADDGKRYRLLTALVAEGADDDIDKEKKTLRGAADAWRMLHEECPWLSHCDTRFRRRIWSGLDA